jgi:acetylornithine deacetylase/succinyl-diaminopimelate desuccinylase-like protein
MGRGDAAFSLFMRQKNSNRKIYEKLELLATYTKQTLGSISNRKKIAFHPRRAVHSLALNQFGKRPLAVVLFKRATRKLENQVSRAESITSKFLIDNFEYFCTLRALILAAVAVGTIAAGVAAYGFAAAQANPSAGQHVRAAVQAYRRAHEVEIMREFVKLLSIPDVASDRVNIQKNAELVERMLEARGFRVQMLPTAEGRGPVIFGELDAPGAKHTIIFYSHYDGQPVNPANWTGTKPFVPALRTDSIDAGGKLIPFPEQEDSYKNNWRIYARASGDDKAPIIALLAAVDALRANRIPMAVNLKVVYEGEEEDSSPHLEATVDAHKNLFGGDVIITADGPVDQSGRPLIFFGNRGVISVRLEVFGPLHPLHSGHYGNWAPNPAMRLAQLLASMKDAEGRVTIANFYDGVVPLGPAEQKAIAEAPNNDAHLLQTFGLALADGGGKKLLELLNEPSLNIDGLESGWTGAQAKTIIPDEATASLDMRLVKNISPEEEFARLVAHIRKQGYYVIDRAPTMSERLKYSRIAEVTHDHGYPAVRTRMDLPIAAALERAVDEGAGEPAVKIPMLGGSTPMYIFADLGLPVVGVPIANFDDNQHSANENLRIGNLWRGMEIYGEILAKLERN